MGNLRSKLNQLHSRISELKSNDLVRVRYGVWFSDSDGNVIEGSGPTCLIPREEVGSIGIILVPEPVSREEWLKQVQTHKQQQEMSFCNSCGSYLHPESSSYQIGEDNKVRLLCGECYKNS